MEGNLRGRAEPVQGVADKLGENKRCSNMMPTVRNLYESILHTCQVYVGVKCIELFKRHVPAAVLDIKSPNPLTMMCKPQLIPGIWQTS